MKLSPNFLLYTLSIGALYAMFSSRITYFVGGVFIGINYREQLTPYTEPVQEYVVEKAMEVKSNYFPDLKLPIPTIIKPEPEIPKTYFQQITEMIIPVDDKKQK